MSCQYLREGFFILGKSGTFKNFLYLQGHHFWLCYTDVLTSTDALTCGGNPVVWNSEVDGRMDGCEKACVKESSPKIEFLLPLPLRPGKLKNNRKIEGSLQMEMGGGVVATRPCQRKKQNCGVALFRYSSLPHHF